MVRDQDVDGTFEKCSSTSRLPIPDPRLIRKLITERTEKLLNQDDEAVALSSSLSFC